MGLGRIKSLDLRAGFCCLGNARRAESLAPGATEAEPSACIPLRSDFRRPDFGFNIALVIVVTISPFDDEGFDEGYFHARADK